MENIPSNVVLHKHVDVADAIFATISIPLVKNLPVKWFGVIKRVTYKAAAEDSSWEYEPVSDLWKDIDPGSESSVYVSSNE